MREEYDFGGGERGKYAKRFARGCNIVVLDSDLAEEFKSPEAVNRALRRYLALKKSKRRKAGGS